MSQQKAQLINATENVNLSGGLVVSGVTTAGNFIGSFSGTATGLSGTPNLTLGIVTATSFSGDGSNLTGVGVTPFIGVSTAAQSGTTTIDLSLGNVIYFTQDTNTTVAFANTETTQVIDFIRVKDDTTTARTITWPASIIWNGGTAPTLIDSDLDDVQIFNLTTRDQGVTWYGYETMKNDPVNPYPPGLYGWGRNLYGILGLNDTSNRSSPHQIPGTTWSSVHGGNGMTFFLNTDGELYGTGDAAKLGLNTDDSSLQYSSPIQIPGTQWDAIQAGINGPFATKTDGTLWTWGSNNIGQSGQNNTVQYSSPVQIPGTQWDFMAKGTSGHSLVTKTDGTLWTWGNGQLGQLGHNNNYIPYSSPTQIPGTQWNKCFATYQGGMATKTDGTMWSWGYNSSGELGLNDRVHRSSPTQILGTQWSKVSSTWDGNAVLGLKTDGTLWVWGGANNGSNGLNDTISRSSPTQIPGTQWDGANTHYAGSYASKSDGTLWTWGYGNHGSAANNGDASFPVSAYRSSPIQIPGTWSRTGIGDIFNGTFAFKI